MSDQYRDPELEQLLRSWRAPQPTAAETAALTGKLTALLEERERRPAVRLRRWLARRWALQVLRSQLRIATSEVLLASVLVLLLGTLVTLALRGRMDADAALPLMLLAPLVSAVSVASLYDPAADNALELLLSVPTSLRAILLARLMIIYSANLVAALLASGLVAWVTPDLVAWELVGGWLAPMTLLSTLAFLLTATGLRGQHTIAICLALWSTQVVRTLPLEQQLDLYIPDLLSAAQRPLLLGAALLCCVLGTLAAGREERWLWN